MGVDEMKETIRAAVPEAEVHIYDPDGQHFQALVISPAFEKMPLVRQHQMVMKALKEAFETSVHALGLKTFTPEKWANEKQNYGL
jgi:acid stress-induced BolA-like protein IbaG/YrbA